VITAYSSICDECWRVCTAGSHWTAAATINKQQGDRSINLLLSERTSESASSQKIYGLTDQSTPVDVAQMKIDGAETSSLTLLPLLVVLFIVFTGAGETKTHVIAMHVHVRRS